MRDLPPSHRVAVAMRCSSDIDSSQSRLPHMYAGVLLGIVPKSSCSCGRAQPSLAAPCPCSEMGDPVERFHPQGKAESITSIPLVHEVPDGLACAMASIAKGTQSTSCLAIPSRAGVLNGTVDRAGISKDAKDARIPANMAVII